MSEDYNESKESSTSEPKEKLPASTSKSTNEYPYTFDQFAVQLVCGAYSNKNALNNKWSISNVIDGLRAVKRFNHRHSDEMSLLERCLRDDEDLQGKAEEMEVDVSQIPKPVSSPRPSTSSRRTSTSQYVPHHIRNRTTSDSTRAENEGDMTDGYFMLNLRIKASLTTNILNSVENEPLLADFLNDLPPPTSTLHKFAECGGLKALSNAVDVIDRIDNKLKEIHQALNKNTNPQLKFIKEEIVNVRKNLNKQKRRQYDYHCTSNFSVINQLLQHPLLTMISKFLIVKLNEKIVKCG